MAIVPDGTSSPGPELRAEFDLKRVNEDLVKRLKGERASEDDAMSTAIGGSFDLVGRMQLSLLRHYGLMPDGYLIDVGCGAGRLAQPLSRYLKGPYLGIDLVGELVDYARRTTDRPDWKFQVIDHIGIPERDGRADMVCFFSVLTHLLHEHSYWYLEEAKRVLKPGGRIVASFLEFRDAGHWSIFESSLVNAKAGIRNPLNVFMDREGIMTWSNYLGLKIEEIRSGFDVIVPEGAIGQSLFVYSKPL